MQRAATLLAGLKADGVEIEDLARAAWRKAVGPRLEQRTRAACMVRSTLVVEVEDAVWQRQLNAIRGHILGNMAKLLGPGHIADIEFRIGVPRRPAQREEASPSPGLFADNTADEANRIADPVLRRLYREDRSRQARRAAAAKG